MSEVLLVSVRSSVVLELQRPAGAISFHLRGRNVSIFRFLAFLAMISSVISQASTSTPCDAQLKNPFTTQPVKGRRTQVVDSRKRVCAHVFVPLVLSLAVRSLLTTPLGVYNNLALYCCCIFGRNQPGLHKRGGY